MMSMEFIIESQRSHREGQLLCNNIFVNVLIQVDI